MPDAQERTPGQVDGRTPGSTSAIAAGCICAAIDNGHGAGYMGQSGVFVITVGCPVHHIAVVNRFPDADASPPRGIPR